MTKYSALLSLIDKENSSILGQKATNFLDENSELIWIENFAYASDLKYASEGTKVRTECKTYLVQDDIVAFWTGYNFNDSKKPRTLPSRVHLRLNSNKTPVKDLAEEIKQISPEEIKIKELK